VQERANMIKIENGYIILEFDQEYNEMPPGFDLDLDYFMTTAIENRRPIEGKNLPAYLKKLNKAKDEFKDKEAFVKNSILRLVLSLHSFLRCLQKTRYGLS